MEKRIYESENRSLDTTQTEIHIRNSHDPWNTSNNLTCMAIETKKRKRMRQKKYEDTMAENFQS